ncbi:MAG: shikimate dehydrogenase [Gammaproteobacteria bacterium]|nr:shikimate dehydrogenase [Gammaproteobacteria bacterium]
MPDRYGVIGHPIAHSKSPVIHQQFAKQTHQSMTYEAFDIRPADLASQLNTLVDDGVKGLNVTVPHKNAVVDLIDEWTDRARQAGAVNTISIDDNGRMSGDNTDGVGLQRDLTENLTVQLAGRRILILGAGGATQGIVPALLEREPEQLCIANRTPEKAIALAKQFKDLGDINAIGFTALNDQTFDLIINATSAGLAGEVPPFPPSLIHKHVVCYDLSYSMSDTPFCLWAKNNGGEQVYQGWGMLIEQAAESFFIWRDVQPETEPLRAMLP